MSPWTADQILYNEEIPESKNYVSTTTDPVLKTLVGITLERGADPKKVKVLTPKEVLFEGSRNVAIPDQTTEGRFYVYGADGVEEILSDPAAAVMLGDDLAGTVADDAGRYIFQKGQAPYVESDHGDQGRESGRAKEQPCGLP